MGGKQISGHPGLGVGWGKEPTVEVGKGKPRGGGIGKAAGGAPMPYHS